MIYETFKNPQIRLSDSFTINKVPKIREIKHPETCETCVHKNKGRSICNTCNRKEFLP